MRKVLYLKQESRHARTLVSHLAALLVMEFLDLVGNILDNMPLRATSGLTALILDACTLSTKASRRVCMLQLLYYSS